MYLSAKLYSLIKSSIALADEHYKQERIHRQFHKQIHMTQDETEWPTLTQ